MLENITLVGRCSPIPFDLAKYIGALNFRTSWIKTTWFEYLTIECGQKDDDHIQVCP